MTDQGRKSMPSSFAGKLRAGWTKEQLMMHYSLSEERYERILTSLEHIKKTAPFNSKEAV